MHHLRKYIRKKIYDEQFITVTIHKNVQNYYNEKCPMYLTFDLSTEQLPFMTLKGGAKFEEKLTCGLENDMRNFVNFHQSFQLSLKIGILMGSFNPK